MLAIHLVFGYRGVSLYRMMLLAAAAAGAACRLAACVACACACAQCWSPLAADGCRLHGGRLRRPTLLCCFAVALAAFAGLLFCFPLGLLFAAAVALAGPFALPYTMLAWRLWDDLTTFL